jgi:hypothetical protein
MRASFPCATFVPNIFRSDNHLNSYAEVAHKPVCVHSRVVSYIRIWNVSSDLSKIHQTSLKSYQGFSSCFTRTGPSTGLRTRLHRLTVRVFTSSHTQQNARENWSSPITKTGRVWCVRVITWLWLKCVTAPQCSCNHCPTSQAQPRGQV